MNTISPSFGNTWDNMGFNLQLSIPYFLVVLSKKAQFYKKSFKLSFWYILESLQNQNENVHYFSNLWWLNNFEGMPDNL